MIKGVFFDLDATLFDREACVREVVAAQHHAFQRELTAVDASLYSARVLALDAHGYGKKDGVYRQIAQEFQLPHALAARLLADFWERYHQAGRLFETAGVKLGIITNGATTTQQSKIDRLGLNEFCEAVLISEREGVRKSSCSESYSRLEAPLALDGRVEIELVTVCEQQHMAEQIGGF
ncbi:MAG: hypothetical protein RL701_5233, partial [Pseudomonadota bacterium]